MSLDLAQMHQRINVMTDYGKYLQEEDREKGDEVIQLAKDLHLKLTEFLEQQAANQDATTSLQSLTTFKEEFIQLLHSKDHKMQEHREEWKPILVNILLVLGTFGIGLIAIGVNTIATVAQGKKMTMNNCLFFARTEREHIVNYLDHEFQEIAAPQMG